MRIGVSGDGTKVDRHVIIDTPKEYEKGIEAIKTAAHGLLGGAAPYGLALGLAGTISRDKKKLVSGPNLAGWVEKSIVEDLKKVFNVPVFIENDAVMAGLGEAHHGAGRGFSIVAYMTVSTGVGGARIVNGLIDEKTVGFEPGNQIIDADKTIAPHAIGNTFENYVSGTAVTQETGKKPKEITDPEFWDNEAKLLAYGLNNTIVHWSPDVMVLGGSMITGDPAIPLENIEKHLKGVLKVYKELPQLKKAELGDIGGLYGALEYVKQQGV